MPTVNEALRDGAIRHAIGLQRLSSGMALRVSALLRRVESDAVRKLQRSPTAFTQARLRAVLSEIRGLYADLDPELYDEMVRDLSALARYESGFSLTQIGLALPISWSLARPTEARLLQLVRVNPVNGAPLREWTRRLTRGASERARDAIRIGMVEGETTDQIVRRLTGTATLRYRDGQFIRGRRGLEGLVRTAVASVAADTRTLIARQNSDLVKGVQWVATLDTRTTDICISRDGQVYPVDDGPRPPAHVNCRSTITFVLSSWEELGLDPSQIPEGARASMDGQVPAKLTYPKWLRQQPAAIQDEVLGQTRGRLFRSGGLDITSFVDDTGRSYTLDELRRREGEAFRAANV